ncbi:MAG: hypothetical protein OXK81_11350 [Chloroflexota bacterium]|nr:hypothetical protein [Chloroflexota bacterium]MDE2931979.1 hypothetical protein [Chloroflexota bacterium]
MILFFDEDMGTTIPKFLSEADRDVEIKWLLDLYSNENDPRRQDVGWLEEAGRNGWLVISCNKKILSVEFERQAILEHKVGIVFFASGQISRLTMMRTILNKWDWLKSVNSTLPRPFAQYIYARGGTRQVSL